VLILSNRDQDRSGKTKEFDFLINRWTELELIPSEEAWLVWADEHDVGMVTQAFAAHNTDIVFASKVPEKQQPWLTPRSLVAADKKIKEALALGIKLDDPFLRQNLAGAIGDGGAHGYIAFAAIRDKLPKQADIMADPLTAFLPDELDQRMFITFFLASKADRANFPQFCKYMKRMQKNFGVAFIRSAGKRDKALLSTTDFTNWSIENQALLAAVHAN
jgi:hypothetical protein